MKLDFDLRDKMKSAITLEKLLNIVSNSLSLNPDSVRRPSKSRFPATARWIICQLAIFELGYTGKEIGTFLHLKASGVSLASRRGEKALKADSELMKSILFEIAK